MEHIRQLGPGVRGRALCSGFVPLRYQEKEEVAAGGGDGDAVFLHELTYGRNIFHTIVGSMNSLNTHKTRIFRGRKNK